MPYGTDQLQRPAVQGPGQMAPMHAKNNDSKKTRRRIIAGVAAAGIAVGAYGVYASTLTVADSSSFAAGTGTVASGCDTSVDTLLTVATAPAAGTFASSGVTVSAVDGTACDGKTLQAWGLDASGNPIAGATGTANVATGTSSYAVEWGTPVADANDIKSVAVIIK